MKALATLFSLYSVVKAAVIALTRISFGVTCLTIARWPFLSWGYAWLDIGGGFGITNIVALTCLAIGGGLLLFGLSQLFEALPGITPRRITQAPGQSRFATRADLKRHHVI